MAHAVHKECAGCCERWRAVVWSQVSFCVARCSFLHWLDDRRSHAAAGGPDHHRLDRAGTQCRRRAFPKRSFQIIWEGFWGVLRILSPPWKNRLYSRRLCLVRHRCSVVEDAKRTAPWCCHVHCAPQPMGRQGAPRVTPVKLEAVTCPRPGGATRVCLYPICLTGGAHASAGHGGNRRRRAVRHG